MYIVGGIIYTILWRMPIIDKYTYIIMFSTLYINRLQYNNKFN